MMLLEEMMVAAATTVLGAATLVAAVILAAFSVVMSAAARRRRGGRDDRRCDQDRGCAHDRAQTEHDTSPIWNRSQVRCAPIAGVRSRPPIGKTLPVAAYFTRPRRSRFRVASLAFALLA
jgi:hypothetical protein